jgi:PEP-CTERM motif
MRLKTAILLILATFAATAASAKADLLVAGTAGGGTQSFNLDLAVTPDAVSGYDITSATGTVDGIAVSLIPNPAPGATSTSPSGAFYYDNIVFTSGNAFDLEGVLLTSGSNEINIFYYTSDPVSGDLYFYTPASGYSNAPIDYPSVSVSNTPEPSSLALLGTGILAAAGATRRRLKRVA